MEDESVLERILNGDEDPTALPVALLQHITNDFSEERKIGDGGFGAVYKGVVQNGIIVAVKRMYVNEHTVDDRSFRREINSLMKINHPNVVRFLGFCSNTFKIPIEMAGSKEFDLVNVRERLFCLEYIGNGSLDKHITDELRGLEWETRYEIITGICNGLCYLHEEKKIVHMDLKPANILLHGKYMVPKITDFGLSRPDENSHTMAQSIFGIRGYIAPEYENYGKFSFKADIYSLGAIIIELVTGCKSIPDKNNVLRRWRHRWSKPPTLLQYQQVTRCIDIAVRCREQKPEARPSILEIISFLSKSESTDVHTGQESTYLDDDMLGIEPLELQFTFKLNKEMSWSVKLTNKTKACFAFNIERPSREYTIRPDKGIVPPGCNEYLVQITVQPQERAPQVTQYADKFIVHSTKVSEGLRDEGITENIFYEKAPGKVVDEVDLMVVYVPVEAVSSKTGSNPHHISLQHLKDITDNFSEDRILGSGGFGVVYKGVLQGEIVAVKKLAQSTPKSHKQFKNEVDLLMTLEHPNIVRLVGYCYDTQQSLMPFEGEMVVAHSTERLLCLECMRNGSLDKYISDVSSGLDWHKRCKIIEGISFGLQYLHEEANGPIIHLDLKPANILLGENLVPKITDFGLSRLFDKKTMHTTVASGTLGYMAVEYQQRGIITPMADIFSLGVIILEVITGHRDYPYDIRTHSEEFIELELQKWRNRLHKEPVCTSLEIDCQQIERYIQIGLICVNTERGKRPTMNKIIDMLQGLESMDWYIRNELSSQIIMEEP